MMENLEEEKEKVWDENLMGRIYNRWIYCEYVYINIRNRILQKKLTVSFEIYGFG